MWSPFFQIKGRAFVHLLPDRRLSEMKCPKCQFDNKEEAKFCKKCGTKLEFTCPSCGHPYEEDSLFCEQCGQRLEEVVAAEKEVPEAEGERKHVTVLFSDLSGYTAISEKLDPEEVKEIMSRIFGEIAQVVTKYEGFVEKFVGDAVMALFGVPKAHEDDPIRAIRAAREIHELVDALSPEVEKNIGQAISMHTGINTGLVVTGEVDMEKGTYGVAGDTINLASRLSSLAKAGEILVGPGTYRQAEGYFTFEDLEPTPVKGKAEPIQIYKVLSQKDRPITIHRLSGLRADLIGRKAEMAQFEGAVEKLREGKSSIFSICGDAGTGKSRIVEEFKSTLDLKEFQWLEGHAYAYSQNIPYYPLIDLLNRVFQIEEGDLPEKVRERVESGIQNLVGKKEDIVHYVGGLYAISYPEVEDVSPEFWKSQLQKAIQAILSALAQRAPTIFFLEDLHWADSTFLELLRNTLLEVRQPAIVLCAYRPLISLFTSHQLNIISKIHNEIRLQDLSPSEAQDMVESLLRTDSIPSELQQFVQKKVEGNPFYLEEVINSLIESETLIRDNGTWKLTRQISEIDISSTIHGVISARFDRLEKETKRILQEASVIGRAFLYEILRKVTEFRQDVDRCLRGLEQLDLVRTRSLQPDLEYMFKHALTQEVAYNGLLKKDRQEIHERIALVMEHLFQDRLPEFYETLAFHFKQGKSILKAVDYLMKSGEKSVGRYAVGEAHQYYKEAFDILSNRPDKSQEEEELLIDLLVKWALVFYHRGDFGGLDKLFSAHEELAETLDDKARLGMFYAWLGFAVAMRRGRPKESYQYLIKALEIGEEIGNQQVIGYACTWLIWTCADWGLLDEAIVFGEKAQEISRILELDHYLFYKSLAGMAHTYWFRGESKKNFEIGRTLLNYGKRHSSIRSLVVGHIYTGTGYLAAGNFTSAVECYRRAVDVAADPIYSHWSKIFLGITYAYKGQFQEAEETLQEIASYCDNFGCKYIRPYAYGFLAIIMIDKGHMSQGLKMLEEERQSSLENERRILHAMLEHVLGKVYLQIAQGAGPKSLSFLAKNIGFLMKNVPFASQKAEAHFNKAIEVFKKTGGKGQLGMAYLDLGLLYKAKRKRDKARECISEAVNLFEQCEAEVYLRQAKEALEDLG
jgi:class 3 adenylate cyclase/tetratricopeptide (TPR) repeat protein